MLFVESYKPRIKQPILYAHQFANDQNVNNGIVKNIVFICLPPA